MNRKIEILKPKEKKLSKEPSKEEVLKSLKKEIDTFKGRKNSDIYLLKELAKKNEPFSQTDIRMMKGYKLRDKNGNKTKEYLQSIKKLKSFEEKGYIKNIGKEQGKVLYEIEDVVRKELERENLSINLSFNVTAFDKYILALTDDNGKLDLSKIDRAKEASIIKRLETFKNAGHIKEKADGTYLDEAVICDIRAKVSERQVKLQRQKERTLELKLELSEERTIKDINRFGMLSKEQIEKYIGKIDYKALLKENILCYDKKYDVYTLGDKGKLYAKALDKNALKYKTKAKGRREEIEHDKLIYTEYKKEIARLKSKGVKIVGTFTDRELRSREAKEYGHIVNSLPDFRIEYYEKGVEGICRLDIEIDVGYKDEVITGKIKGMVSSAQNAGIKANNYSILWVKKSKGKVSESRIVNSGKKGLNELKRAKRKSVRKKVRKKNKVRCAFKLVRAINKTGRSFKQKRALKASHTDRYLDNLKVKKAEDEI